MNKFTCDWYTENIQYLKNTDGVTFKALTNEEYKDNFFYSTYVSKMYLGTSATDVVRIFMHHAQLLGSTVRYEHNLEHNQGTRVIVACSRVDKDLLIQKGLPIPAGTSKLVFKEWIYNLKKPEVKSSNNLEVQSGQPSVAGQLDQLPNEIQSASLVGQLDQPYLAAQPDQPIEADQLDQPNDLQVQPDQPSVAGQLDQQGHPAFSFDETCDNMSEDQLLADTLLSDSLDCSEGVDME